MQPINIKTYQPYLRYATMFIQLWLHILLKYYGKLLFEKVVQIKKIFKYV